MVKGSLVDESGGVGRDIECRFEFILEGSSMDAEANDGVLAADGMVRRVKAHDHQRK